MKKTAAVSLLAAEVALLTTVRMANAAETDASAGKDQLEEVIVVAQRREQSVLDVPVSATVFNGEALDVAGYDDAKDYLLQTPNVSFIQGGGNGAREIIISIRGISDLKGSEKVLTQSAFATYVDEFAAGTLASGQSNPDTYDVEGIEILRGPQGVFFGRNSEGGAINIRTKKPTEEFYGRVDAGVGRFNTYELGAVVNGALSENVFGRLTARSEISDGPVKNRHPVGGGSDSQYVHVRGQLRWQPTEATTLDLQVNHTIDNIDIAPKLGTCVDQGAFGLPITLATPQLLGGIGCYDPDNAFSDRVRDGRITLPAGTTLADFRDNRDSVYQDTVDHTDNKTSMAIVKLYHELNDSMSLTSITGYSQSEQDQFLDLDRSGVLGINRDNGYETDGISQELRLASIGEHRVDWTVGGLYYREEFEATNAILIETVVGPWVPGDTANENTISNKIDGWAAFGNLEWHMTDSLSLIAGARFSRDRGENEWSDVYAACSRRIPGAPLDTSQTANGNGACQLTPQQQLLVDRGGLPQFWNGTRYVITGGRYEQLQGRFARHDTDDFSPRLALNWRPSDDSSLYVSASKGYKPGGGQANPDGRTTTKFEGEEMWNYEIGGNAYLFDRRLLLQGAVFYMDWQDYQLQSRLEYCELASGAVLLIEGDDFDQSQCVDIRREDQTLNQPKAVSKGAELAGTMRITDGLTFTGSYGYLDASIEEGFGIVNDQRVDISGSRLGNSPEHTAAATIEQAFPLLGGDSAVALNWSYRDKSSLGNFESLVTDRFPRNNTSFSLVNLRYTHKWKNNRLTVNVDNLLEDEYYTGGVTFSWVGPQLVYNPRTWSVMWTSEFE